MYCICETNLNKFKKIVLSFSEWRCPHDSQGVIKESCMRNLESAVATFPGMNLLGSRFTENGKSGRF